MSYRDIEKVNIRGVNFFSLDMDMAVIACEEMLNEGGFHSVHTPNSEIVELCIEDNRYYDIINSADLIIPDGAGVILASKILGKPLKYGKVAGVELCENLIKLAAEKGCRVFFLGGKEGIAQAAAEKMQEKYEGLQVCGVHNGYFSKCDSIEKAEFIKNGGKIDDDEKVIEEINNSRCDILLVCLGVPAQEIWMNTYRNRLDCGLAGGFGGSFDIYSGASKRAPDIFIKLGLEWLYRLIKEPKRIGRMMKIPKFIFSTLFSK